jgi:hypothetical protein
MSDFTSHQRAEVLRVLLNENPVVNKDPNVDAQTAALHILNQPAMRRKSAQFDHEVASGRDRSIEDVLAHEVNFRNSFFLSLCFFILHQCIHVQVLPHIGLTWSQRHNLHKLVTMAYILRRMCRVHFQYEVSPIFLTFLLTGPELSSRGLRRTHVGAP